MTFPLDPAARAFHAKASEKEKVGREPVEPPEAFQAEDGEHAVVRPPEYEPAGPENA
jgi:hypothetical protein